MITNPKDRIETSQATVILINYILAAGILTLPRTAAEKVKTPDVWITVILGGVIAMVTGVIMVKLSQQFPNKTFYQYSQDIVGKWIGGLLSLIIIVYFFTLSSFEVRILEGSNKFLFTGRNTWLGYYHDIYVGKSLFDDRWHQSNGSYVWDYIPNYNLYFFADCLYEYWNI